MNPLLKIVIYPFVKLAVETSYDYICEAISNTDFFKEKDMANVKLPDRSKWTKERNILVYVAYNDYLNSKKVLGIKHCATKSQVCNILNTIMGTTKVNNTLIARMYLVIKDDTVKNTPNIDIQIDSNFGHKIREIIISNNPGE